jgi:hypothetical protein
MLEIKVSTKVNGAWTDLPVPEALTEKIAMLTELAGSESVIKITTSQTTHFLCGTEEIRQSMAKVQANKVPPGAAVCMTMTDAHKMIEHDPEKYCFSIQLFSTKEHVVEMFPPMPAGKGWVKDPQETGK